MAVLGDRAEKRLVLVEALEDVLADTLAAVTAAKERITVGIAVGDALDHLLDLLARQLPDFSSLLAELFASFHVIFGYFHAFFVAARVVRVESIVSGGVNCWLFLEMRFVWLIIIKFGIFKFSLKF